MFSICFVTTPSMEVAKTIGSSLVKQRLIACCNVIPGVVSIFEWEGKVECDDEHLMILKTRTEHVSTIIDEVKKMHPYDCPEVVSFVQGEGNPGYLKWLQENTNFKAAAAQIEKACSEEEKKSEDKK